MVALAGMVDETDGGRLPREPELPRGDRDPRGGGRAGSPTRSVRCSSSAPTRSPPGAGAAAGLRGATSSAATSSRLGIHLQYGGGQAGYIAVRDDPRFVMEMPSRLVRPRPDVGRGRSTGSVTWPTSAPPSPVREEGKEWVGTAAALWGITAGRLPGPHGAPGDDRAGRGDHGADALRDGAARRRRPASASATAVSHHFREFVVDVGPSGKTVAEVNAALLDGASSAGSTCPRTSPSTAVGAVLRDRDPHPGRHRPPRRRADRGPAMKLADRPQARPPPLPPGHAGTSRSSSS